MSGDQLDRELHDYIDGRLSEPDRRAFEKRMERDPELRLRAESYRSIGTALRETEIELPPGFYSRARERFETSRSGARPWRRVISWEAAGLAAAAMLLVAILLPQAWERRGTDDMLQVPPMTSKPAAPAEPESIVSETESKETVTEQKAAGAKNEVAALGEEQARRADESEDDKDARARSLQVAPRQQPAPPAEIAQDAALGDVTADATDAGYFAELEATDAPAVAAPAEPERMEALKSVGERAAGPAAKKTEGATAEARAVGRIQAETDAERSFDETEKSATVKEIETRDFAQAQPGTKRDKAQDSRELDYLKSEPGAYAVALPDGFMDAFRTGSGIQVVDDRETWDRMRAASGDPNLDDVLRDDGPDFGPHRLVLIAPRSDPLDCKALRWRREEPSGSVVIESVATPFAIVPAPGGCAMWIPAGDEPVTLRLVGP